MPTQPVLGLELSVHPTTTHSRSRRRGIHIERLGRQSEHLGGDVLVGTPDCETTQLGILVGFEPAEYPTGATALARPSSKIRRFHCSHFANRRHVEHTGDNKLLSQHRPRNPRYKAASVGAVQDRDALTFEGLGSMP
jgi:hypothetical protein